MPGNTGGASESGDVFVVVAEFEVKPDKMEAFLTAALDDARRRHP